MQEAISLLTKNSPRLHTRLTSLSHHRPVSETRSVVPQNAPHSGWICFLSGIMFLSHLNFLKLEVNSGSLITFRFSLFKYDVCVPSYQDRKSSLLNIIIFLGAELAELVLATGFTKMDELLAALSGLLEVNPDGQPDRGDSQYRGSGSRVHHQEVRSLKKSVQKCSFPACSMLLLSCTGLHRDLLKNPLLTHGESSDPGAC